MKNVCVERVFVVALLGGRGSQGAAAGTVEKRKNFTVETVNESTAYNGCIVKQELLIVC